jgi:type II secretory pathway predicted ATPase ExeA
MLPIYCQHFGLKREPFSISPDPSFLYLSDSHKEALAQLVYGINTRRGFVVLTGEVGTGKTTLIQCLLEELNGTTKTALIFNMIFGPQDLLRYVCEKFGLVTNHDNHRQLHDYISLLESFLVDCYQNGKNVALIIDEAQNLSSEVLENVRLLSNFETAQEKLLQILLVGQPELGNRLNRADVRQIKQRVALRHHLSPLNLTECERYIAKRLEIAGGGMSLFPAHTIAATHKYTGGIPRLVNILCDNGLLAAYGSHKTSVDPTMIADIALELQLSASPQAREAKVPRLDQPIVNWLPDRGLDQSLGTVPPSNNKNRDFPSNDPDKTIVTPLKSQSQTTTASDLTFDAASPRFFDKMIHDLTKFMGPMASYVVKERIAISGESLGAFPKSRLTQLVNDTSEEISDDKRRLEFIQSMLAEIRALQSDH